MPKVAKESLMETDRHARIAGARPALSGGGVTYRAIRGVINALGIGAQGLGGLTTVLDVKLRTYPTHAASLPVALIPNCAADRHISFTLDGSGPAGIHAPRDGQLARRDSGPLQADAVRVDLDTLTREQMATWRAGQTLLLSGKLLTARDAAHRRIVELLDAGQPLPADFNGRALYYVGPVDPVRDEAVGPAGPTTSTRMDKFMDRVLGATGLFLTIGKAERGLAASEAIHRHRTTYLIAVGGAAYLVSQAIRHARVVAFADLGMEAIYEFDVKDMPVTVGIDLHGESIHTTGPNYWQADDSRRTHSHTNGMIVTSSIHVMARHGADAAGPAGRRLRPRQLDHHVALRDQTIAAARNKPPRLGRPQNMLAARVARARDDSRDALTLGNLCAQFAFVHQHTRHRRKHRFHVSHRYRFARPGIADRHAPR